MTCKGIFVKEATTSSGLKVSLVYDPEIRLTNTLSVVAFSVIIDEVQKPDIPLNEAQYFPMPFDKGPGRSYFCTTETRLGVYGWIMDAVLDQDYPAMFQIGVAFNTIRPGIAVTGQAFFHSLLEINKLVSQLFEPFYYPIWKCPKTVHEIGADETRIMGFRRSSPSANGFDIIFDKPVTLLPKGSMEILLREPFKQVEYACLKFAFYLRSRFAKQGVKLTMRQLQEGREGIIFLLENRSTNTIEMKKRFIQYVPHPTFYPNLEKLFDCTNSCCVETIGKDRKEKTETGKLLE